MRQPVPLLVRQTLWGLMAATLLAALPAVLAGGTGYEVATDGAGDNSGGGADADILRLGMTSDASNIYYWIKVGSSSVSFDPTLAANHPVELFYPVDMQDGTGVQYYPDATYQTSGVWVDSILWHSNSFSGGVAGWDFPLPTIVCNEMRYSVPRALWDVPPVDGDLWTGMMVTAWNLDGIYDTMAGGPPFDQPPGTGTWTVGDQGQMWQPAPSIVSVTPVGDNTLRVTYAPAADNGAQPVGSYRIYRSVNGGNYVLAGTSTTTQFDDTGLTTTNPTTYRYKVAAVNCPQLPAQTAAPPSGEPAYTGGESLRSAPSNVVTPDFRPIAPTPVNLNLGTPATTSLNLVWTASAYDCPSASCTPSGSGGSGVAGYKLFSGNPPAGTYVMDLTTAASCVGASCTHTFTGLTPGTNYCYYLQAYDAYAAGPNLGPIPATAACRTTNSGSSNPPPPPPPPVGPPPPPPPPVTGCTAVIQVMSHLSLEDEVVVAVAGSALSFVDKSATPAGVTVNRWAWEFGDGATSTEQHPSHAYLSPGNFTARLSVWDTAGCTALADQAMRIVDQAGSTPAGQDSGAGASLLVEAGKDLKVPEGGHVDLVAVVVSGPDRDSLTFTWRQLDGPRVATTGAGSPVLSFDAPGVPDPDHPLLLSFGVTASDGFASSPEDFVDVVVYTTNHRPVARAGPDQTVAPGATVTLDGTGSSDPEGTSLSGIWELVVPVGDDGSQPSNAPHVTDLVQDGLVATFTAPRDAGIGYVDLRLNVTDETYSSADTVRIWIQDPAPPQAPFVALAEPDGTVSFLATGEATEYSWDFGDGNGTVTDGRAASHRYAKPGAYTVSLSLDGGEASKVTVNAAGRSRLDASRPEEAASGAASVATWLPVMLIATAAAVLVAGLLVWALRHRRA